MVLLYFCLSAANAITVNYVGILTNYLSAVSYGLCIVS